MGKTPSQNDTEDSERILASIQKNFHSSVKHPEAFLSAQPKKQEKFKTITKSLYDLSIQQQDQQNDPNILPELILDSMDEEQIWQQLELRNNAMIGTFLKETSRLLALQKDTLSFKCRAGNESEDGQSESVVEDEQESCLEESDETDEDEEESDDEAAEEEPKPKKRLGKPSVVDDQFFKLSEMEEFLKVEDEKEMVKERGKPKRANEGDGLIDYFEGEDEEDSEVEDIKYDDFFAEKPKEGRKLKKRGREESSEEGEAEESAQEEEISDDENIKSEAEPNSDDSEDEDHKNKPKSSFEERQERLKQRIKEHEENALGEKPWQLKGEITATNRPQNSLLEEILEFDSTTRPAPVITEETTLRLEDIIRQRIKDRAWDDVERKYKPVQTPQELRKKLVLDQDKSKESLAQIYEKEYRNQIEKLNPNEAETTEEEPSSHREIRTMMRSLFAKLDALSNFHYTPKSAIPEPRIITNTPAIELEEVAPVAVSTAKLLAPEEIRGRVKGGILGRTERSRTDKNRERRQKKLKQKLIGKAKEEKLEAKQKAGQALTGKEEKAKLLKNVMKHRNVQKMTESGGADGKAIKSSKAFFTQLQDNQAANSRDSKTKKKKAPKEEMSAKRLKL